MSANKIKRKLTEDEIIAQCIVFFIAGFETSGSVVSSCMFELAKNADIQEQLYKELTETLSGINEESQEYYETVMHKLPYLQAVIQECLRKYPPLVRFDRINHVDGYKLGDLTLEPGVLIEVSPFALHHNPEYFPEPERFDPSRFMPENKHLIAPYTYVPFGAGPRNCVGMRFAMQEIKLLFAKIVQQFRFVCTDKTPEKLTFKRFKPLLNVVPFSVQIEKR